MTRDEFEDRYGSLRDEGLTPDDVGLGKRRTRILRDEPPEALVCEGCDKVIDGKPSSIGGIRLLCEACADTLKHFV